MEVDVVSRTAEHSMLEPIRLSYAEAVAQALQTGAVGGLV